MTRDEAVARAVNPDLWRWIDQLEKDGPPPLTHRPDVYRADLERAKAASLHDAQLAIEANDAWLADEEKRATTPCPRCGTRCGVGDFECRGCGEAVLWNPGA